MGRGGGGRGRKGSGKGRADGGYWHGGADWGQQEQWHGYSEYDQGWASPQVPAPPLVPQRPLAAQWRFYCRALRQRAPEEEVRDARQQVGPGDHLVVHYDWGHGEQHGIVADGPGDGGGRQRRGDRQEPHSVVHWDGSQLQRSPLSHFARGGRLLRVGYPHWACQCSVPAASTLKASVVVEQELKAQEDGAVARQAGGALRRGWTPRWSQAADLEFCIEMKTGAGLPFEVHARSTVRSALLAPLGCALRGEAAPSKVLGAGAEGASPPAGQTLQLSAHLQGGSKPAAAQELFSAVQAQARPGAAQAQAQAQAAQTQAAAMTDFQAMQGGAYDMGYAQGYFPQQHQQQWGGCVDQSHMAYPQEEQWDAAGCGQGWPYPAAAQAFAQGGCGAYGAPPAGQWAHGGAQQDQTMYQ